MAVYIEFSENPISKSPIPCSNLKKRLIKKEISSLGQIFAFITDRG